MHLKLHMRWIAPVLWMAVLFFLSHESAAGSTARSAVIVNLLGGLGLDWAIDTTTVLVRKAAHLSAYAVLGGLFVWALRSKKLSLKNTAVFSVILAFAYAITDEVHQVFVPARSGQVSDVLLDTIGAILGVALVLLIVGLCSDHRIRSSVKKPALN